MATYCTAADAEAKGAASPLPAGTLEEAAERVDAFTGTWFDSRTGTFRVEYDGDGIVFLPAPAITVTSVAVVDPATTIAAGTYRTVGERLYLPDFARGSDVLIAGAEPWRGGWANLLGPAPVLLDVTGTLGLAAVPSSVREASALLAAMLAPAPYTPTTDAEGVPVGVQPLSGDGSPAPDSERVTPWGTDRGTAGRLEATTGLAEADRLLAPWRARYAARWKVG